MKKYLFFIITLTIPNFLFSQTYLGPIGGLNFGWYSGNLWENHISSAEADIGFEVVGSSIPLANLGIFIDMIIIDHLCFSSGISYNVYGQDCFVGSYDILLVEYRQHVIEIPLLLKYSTSNGFNPGLYFIFGPKIQFLIRDYEMKFLFLNEIYENDFFVPNNLFLFSMLGGFGYEIPNRYGLFKIDITYNRNITEPSYLVSDTSSSPYGIINNIALNIYYGSKL